jgi:transcriptional antiterminator NusG
MAQEKTKVPAEPKINWFVLRVISGKEKKLKQQLELEIKRSDWSDIITQILVPTEKVYKLKNGKKVVQERNFFPGYLLLEADENRMKGDVVATINNTPNVIHFLGKDNPIPLRKSEVNRILGKVDEMTETGDSVSEPFIIGESVKITDGPFNEFIGTIEEVYEDKKKLKVTVKIFGRKTPVELNFMQVEKQQ